ATAVWSDPDTLRPGCAHPERLRNTNAIVPQSHWECTPRRPVRRRGVTPGAPSGRSPPWMPCGARWRPSWVGDTDATLRRRAHPCGVTYVTGVEVAVALSWVAHPYR